MRLRAASRFLPLTLALAVAFGATDRAQQEVDWDAVEITARHVAGSVYYLEGRGGNIGLSIGEDGVVMVDDQYAPLTEKILAAIRELTDRDIRFVINTHVHPDHTGGNENLGKMGIVILAHDRVRVRLSDRLPSVALPVLTYSDAVTLHLNDEQVRAFSVPPAHTDGDSFIHFRGSDVLHLGDVFRTTAFPVIDTTTAAPSKARSRRSVSRSAWRAPRRGSSPATASCPAATASSPFAT